MKVIKIGSQQLFGSSFGLLFEPRHEKTGFLHMRKQRHRSALR